MPDPRSLADKLRAMANQTDSPREAAIARAKLDAMGQGVREDAFASQREALRAARRMDREDFDRRARAVYVDAFGEVDAEEAIRSFYEEFAGSANTFIFTNPAEQKAFERAERDRNRAEAKRINEVIAEARRAARAAERKANRRATPVFTVEQDEEGNPIRRRQW